MKIAQITHSYYPHIGGIEVHVREISERLAKHHDVNVITADLEHGLSRTENLNGVKISRFPSLKIGNTGYFSPNIYQHLKKNAFDIIHAHNYHALPAYIASKGAKDNFIFTPHYHGKGSTNLTNVLLKPYHYFGKNIFQTARTIICVSEFEKNLIIRDFHPSENKIKVIPNGINLKDIQKAQPYDFDGNLILYIGRLDRYKNIDLMIRVMPFLPNHQFFIIGKSGNYREELLTLIRTLALDERVKILENVSNAEKYRWLKTCSILINLSGTEAFGMTVIEALAAGKPVLVNDSSSLKEFAQHFTGVYPISIEGSQEKIEETISCMITNTGISNHPTALNEYDWNKIVEQIETIYNHTTT